MRGSPGGLSGRRVPHGPRPVSAQGSRRGAHRLPAVRRQAPPPRTVCGRLAGCRRPHSPGTGPQGRCLTGDVPCLALIIDGPRPPRRRPRSGTNTAPPRRRPRPGRGRRRPRTRHPRHDRGAAGGRGDVRRAQRYRTGRAAHRTPAASYRRGPAHPGLRRHSAGSVNAPEQHETSSTPPGEHDAGAMGRGSLSRKGIPGTFRGFGSVPGTSGGLGEKRWRAPGRAATVVLVRAADVRRAEG